MDLLELNHEEIDALILSIKVAFTTSLILIPISILITFLLSQKDFKLKSFIIGLIKTPLVIPPVALGFILLIFLGNNSVIGQFFQNTFDVKLSFSFHAAIIASTIVSFPLVFNPIYLGFKKVKEDYHSVIKSLRISPFKALYRLYIPMSFSAIISGVLMGFARSLGEFGATMIFAGNIPKESQTIPLAMYNAIQIPGKEESAIKLLLISVIISVSVMIIANFKRFNPSE